MQNRINYRAKLVGMALAVVLICQDAFSLSVYARTDNVELRDIILEITDELEESFSEQYEDAKQEITDLISEKGYDYTMTMETFYDNGNPFKDVDYLDLITKYAAIRQYYVEHGRETGMGFGNIRVLEWNVEEKQLETEVPVIVETYAETEEGLYERTGNRVITEPTVVPVYEQYTATKYKQTGEQEITPETKLLTYGDITLSYVGNDVLFKHFQISEEDIQSLYEEKYEKYDTAINGKALSESIFVNMPVNTAIPENIADYLRNLNSSLTDAQRQIIRVAISLYGKVPYQWGGKASRAGYDNTWWTFNENGEQKGLDCSGYVQWVYMTAGYDTDLVNSLGNTSVILDSLEDISESDLEPGDLGLLNHGETVNHVGIYLGNNFFIHCSSSANTVTIDQFPFQYFKTVQKNGKNTLTNDTITDYSKDKFTESVLENNENTKSVNEDDIYLMAQLMLHEAGNQGFNGKVAVGEVVMNRLHEGSFGESIHDVIYAPGQFSENWELKEITPDDETLLMAEKIIRGELSVFNNPEVLFFRNPMITDNIPATENAAWGSYQWYTCINQHAFYTP